MANLRDIKKRLTNVSVLEKVTQSMKAIASSALSNAKAQRYANMDYYKGCEDIAQRLFSLYSKSNLASNEWLDILFENLIPKSKKSEISVNNFGKENKNIGSNSHAKTLILLVSADRGLCGGYNSSVLKKVQQRIKDIGRDGVILCPIGKKAQAFSLKHKNMQTLNYELSSDFKKLDHDKLMLLVNAICKKIVDGHISKVEVVYSYNKTPLEQEIKNKAIIPIVLPKEGSNIEQKDNVVTEEIAFETGIVDLVKNYISFMIYDVLSEASIAEFSSRLNAMSNANDNCKELRKLLHLEYNRTRQSIITRELIEIISGAESL